MNLQQVTAIQQIDYQSEIYTVTVELSKLGMTPRTEIRVYPLESGWYATVLVGECVFIFTWHSDKITLAVQPFSGFWKNGALIHERD